MREEIRLPVLSSGTGRARAHSGPKALVVVGAAAWLGSVDIAQGLVLRSLNLRTTMLPSYSAMSGSISSAVVTGSVPGRRAASMVSPTIA